VYGRIGVSSIEMEDALSSVSPSTTSSKGDFEDNWKFFGTLGAKGFYPFNETFGVGAFVQGTYFFRDATITLPGLQMGLLTPWNSA